MSRIVSLSLILSCSITRVTSSQCIDDSEIGSNKCSSAEYIQADNHYCSLYMAPSSISGAGYGLFTTKDLHAGDNILPYSDATSIVVCDYEYYGMKEAYWLHPDYVWNGAGLASFECDQSSESVVTFGALCNFHPGTVQDYDDTVVNRFSDSGAGAFSYYKGHQFTATTDIAAGDEIFADYGDHWLDARIGTFADKVPRYDDYGTAAKIASVVEDKMITAGAELNATLSSIKEITGLFNERVASLLPETKNAYEDILKSRRNKLAAKIAETTLEKRGVDWIRENGLCLDNISPGKSTLSQAGQGAFATRYMPTGSMISPAPLLQIMNSDLMYIYGPEWDGETDSVPTGTQLLMNYCFGHKESKLLLCPQTNAILINHCSSRQVGDGQCGDKGPNAKVQWASGWDHNTPSWLELSLDEMEKLTAERSRGLSMEFVAIRDIQPGEEIFIDYGPNWEEEWNRHEKSWKPPTNDNIFGNYTPIKEMAGVEFRTVDELEENPYPANVVTGCYWYEYEEEGYEPDEEGYYWAEDYIHEDGVHVAYTVYICDLLEELDDGFFDVRIPPQRQLTKEVLLTQYPRESIIFRTKPYSSDQHIGGAFRHFIEIEDSLFPSQWKNSELAKGDI